MTTVEWSDTAIAHLDAIRDYVARNSPGYAQALVDRITGRTMALAQMPLMGGEVREYGDPTIREVIEHPYRILYRVQGEQVEVLAVIHGARRLPRTPPG
jgi:plasmid stabilization system protein ParE